MPTVFRWRGHRFFWYLADGSEPPHVHIWKDGKECKIWLNSLEVAYNHGYAPADLRNLVSVTAEQRNHLLEIWHDSFGR
ncbi:MAG TPA: DUF4160 domain-containing protein [Devosia sp.]|jgi:hypothetical protein|uniref:DUF4160 domain-containing protein n=1 Tax=Devosia sp. TaxID=1871048 RepID=UPI002F93D8F5